MSFIDVILGGRGPLLPGPALEHRTANPPFTSALLVFMGMVQLGALVYLQNVEPGYSRELAIGVGVITAGIFVLYYLSLIMRRERRCLISPDILIFAFLVLFHLPGVFFEAIGWIQQETRFWYHYTYVNYAMVLDLTGFIAFLIGYNLFAKLPSFYAAQPRRAVDYSPSWIRVGQAVFLGGVLMHIYFSLTQISIWQMLTTRYNMARYHSGEYDERFWFTGIFLCRTGIFIISVASAAIYGKMIKGWANWLAFWVYIAFIFVTGHRAVVVLTFITPLLAYAFLIRPIRTRVIIVVAIAGLFMMSVGLVVRSRSDKSIGSVERAISENKNLGIFHSIIEAGGSAKAMFRALAVWPHREGYEYGNTFFQGFLRSIPNLSFAAGSLFAEENPARKVMRITEPAGRRAGTGYGFTIIAESYINFGPIGPTIVLGLIGFATRRLFDRAFYTRNPFRMILALVWILGMCNYVRNDSFSCIKPITWAFAIMYLTRLVLTSTLAKAGTAPGNIGGAMDIPRVAPAAPPQAG